jgi:hypothetical protein
MITAQLLPTTQRLLQTLNFFVGNMLQRQESTLPLTTHFHTPFLRATSLYRQYLINNVTESSSSGGISQRQNLIVNRGQSFPQHPITAISAFGTIEFTKRKK